MRHEVSSSADTTGPLEETIQWFMSLEPGFAFLLALPFLVAFAGFCSEYLRKRRPVDPDNSNTT